MTEKNHKGGRKPIELKKIFQIIILYERGQGVRATMRKVGVSDTPVLKYRKIYDEAKEGLEGPPVPDYKG